MSAAFEVSTRRRTSAHDTHVIHQQDSGSGALKEENTRLTSELRDAREKIRNLELQVETYRVNAAKAAALLGVQ